MYYVHLLYYAVPCKLVPFKLPKRKKQQGVRHKYFPLGENSKKYTKVDLNLPPDIPAMFFFTLFLDFYGFIRSNTYWDFKYI